MKVRNSFVSNSSSSSFIIALPHKPVDAADVKKMLFGDMEGIIPNVEYFDKQPTVHEAAYSVYKQCKEVGKAGKSRLIHERTNDYLIYDEACELCGPKPEYGSKEYDQFSKRASEMCATLSTEAMEEWIKEAKAHYPKCAFYVLHYSDNDGGFEPAMEHGNVFYRIPHIRISHH